MPTPSGLQSFRPHLLGTGFRPRPEQFAAPVPPASVIPSTNVGPGDGTPGLVAYVALTPPPGRPPRPEGERRRSRRPGPVAVHRGGSPAAPVVVGRTEGASARARRRGGGGGPHGAQQCHGHQPHRGDPDPTLIRYPSLPPGPRRAPRPSFMERGAAANLARPWQEFPLSHPRCRLGAPAAGQRGNAGRPVLFVHARVPRRGPSPRRDGCRHLQRRGGRGQPDFVPDPARARATPH